MKSEWVKTKIRKARKVELRDNRCKLFPIRLASISRLEKWRCRATDPDEDLAADVRAYHIPDFSNWKDHDAVEAAFADLLRDLQEQAEQDVLLLYDGILQRPQAVDFDFDSVTGFQEHWWGAGHADSRRGSREDQVTGF